MAFFIVCCLAKFVFLGKLLVQKAPKQAPFVPQKPCLKRAEVWPRGWGVGGGLEEFPSAFEFLTTPD